MTNNLWNYIVQALMLPKDARVIFEQRSEEDEGTSHDHSMGMSDPGRGASKCKNPETGLCPGYTSIYVEGWSPGRHKKVVRKRGGGGGGREGRRKWGKGVLG